MDRALHPHTTISTGWTSAWMMCDRPPSFARSPGVMPSLSFMLTSALAATSRWMQSMLAYRAARCRAVWPRRSLATTWAPALSSASRPGGREGLFLNAPHRFRFSHLLPNPKTFGYVLGLCTTFLMTYLNVRRERETGRKVCQWYAQGLGFTRPSTTCLG
jgi:hypothetical protein